MSGILTRGIGAESTELLSVLEVDAVDRLAEGAVRLYAVRGDAGAHIVGDEGRVAGVVDRDVGRASAGGGDLSKLAEASSLRVDRKGGNRGAGVGDCVDRVEEALAAAGGREGQVRGTGGLGNQDRRAQQAFDRIEPGLIDALADSLGGVGAKVDLGRRGRWERFLFAKGRAAKARSAAAKAGRTTRNLRRVSIGRGPRGLGRFAGKMNLHLVLWPDVLVDHGEAGKIVGTAGLFDDGFGVVENLFDGHRVHLTAVVVAGLNGMLEIAAGSLGGKIVGDDVACATLLLDPGEVGHGDPYRLAVYGKANVGSVGVTRGDGDDSSLPYTVELFAGPTVGHFEVFIHG